VSSNSLDPSDSELGLRPAWYRRPGWWLLAAVLAIGGGVGAFRVLRGKEVPVIHAERGNLVHKVVSTGRVMVPARVHLGSTVVAKVILVAAEEGARVKAGDLLVQLDDAAERASVAEASAGVSQARARLGGMGKVAGRTAQAGVDEAAANLAQATRNAERASRLFDSGATTQEEVDQARQSVEVARSRLASAQIAYESASPGGSEHSASSAGLLGAEGGLLAAKARLDATRIVAPADGIVLTRAVEPGDVVQPGQALLVLARDGAVRLSVQADEKNLAVLRVGQRALASADALPGRVFEAKVSYIAPAVDADRGTIELRLDVPRPPPELRPDMTVSVNVEVSRHAGALTLPDHVVRDATAEHPWVLLAVGGRAERRDLAVGISGDGLVEVRGGLSEQDSVILRGAAVEVGARVHPTPARDSDAL
jgi:HlyD family secretion protein